VCLPIFKTLKKISKSEWDEDCNMAFLNLKEYLSNPPVMSRLIVWAVLFLYHVATEGVVSAALIRKEKDVQRPIYYVSCILRDVETHCPPFEKLAFALMFLKSYACISKLIQFRY
jgi:RNase H-like domain found in reverse transcriptase